MDDTAVFPWGVAFGTIQRSSVNGLISGELVTLIKDEVQSRLSLMSAADVASTPE